MYCAFRFDGHVSSLCAVCVCIEQYKPGTAEHHTHNKRIHQHSSHRAIAQYARLSATAVVAFIIHMSNVDKIEIAVKY